MLDFLHRFTHKAELRESRDEIVVGEIVRAMARLGHPTIGIHAGSDRQRIRFLTHRDPVLHSVYVTLDRRTGSGMVSEALLGSKATLEVAAEIKNRISDPDDLVRMVKTDLANLFKLPVIGGIKLDHEMNSVYARVTKIVELGDFVGQGDAGIGKLKDLLSSTVAELKESLRDYKKSA